MELNHNNFFNSFTQFFFLSHASRINIQFLSHRRRTRPSPISTSSLYLSLPLVSMLLLLSSVTKAQSPRVCEWKGRNMINDCITHSPSHSLTHSSLRDKLDSTFTKIKKEKKINNFKFMISFFFSWVRNSHTKVFSRITT